MYQPPWTKRGLFGQNLAIFGHSGSLGYLSTVHAPSHLAKYSHIRVALVNFLWVFYDPTNGTVLCTILPLCIGRFHGFYSGMLLVKFFEYY